MFKRCKHEYVPTSQFLHRAVGPCCKKCGKPQVKHEQFTYKHKTKESFKILIRGWGGFKDVDYALAAQSVVLVLAFPILMICIFLAPFLSVFLSPIIGFTRWIDANRKLRNKVKEVFNND